MTFGYHNHNFEFSTKIGDGVLYDFIPQKHRPKFPVASTNGYWQHVGAGGIAFKTC